MELSTQKGPAFVVLMCIATAINRESQMTFPSVATIARWSRLKERTVQYALRTLENSGELVIELQGWRGRSSIYRLGPKFTLSALPAAPLSPSQQPKRRPESTSR